MIDVHLLIYMFTQLLTYIYLLFFMYNINLTLNNTFLKSDIKMHINITMITIKYNKTF